MLHALVQYARNAGISGEAGFAPKTVHWLINFNSDGQFLGVLHAGDSQERGKRGRVFTKAPHLKFSGDTPMRQFLVETAQYALLFGEDDPDKKLLAKHKYFLSLLGEAVQVEPFLGKVTCSLSDKNTRMAICKALGEQQPKAKSSDNVTFVEVTDAGARIIVEEPTWHAWWRQHFPTLFKVKTESNQLMRCFVSGDLAEPCLTHPKIKGLAGVGGNIETTLVGFNLDAFCSYGLSQSSNAAISSQMAEQYAAALNHLLGSENNTKRLAGTIVVYWYVGDVHDDEDPLTELFAGYSFGQNEVEPSDDDVQSHNQQRHRQQAESRVAKLLDAIRSADENALRLRNARYCALTLSGNRARVVVRDWMEGQFEELVESVDSWLSDLALGNLSATSLCRRPGLERLLTSLLNERKRDQDYSAWIIPVAAHRNAIWLAAIRGSNEHLPRALAERACRQQTTAVMTDEFPTSQRNLSESEKRQEGLRVSAWCARLSLMKAFLLRESRVYRKENIPMSAYLDVGHPRASYQCGRLMAVLQMIQKEAQGDVGTTIAQSHYASASTRPITALPRLETLTQHHLPKIKSMKLRAEFQRLLTEIQGRIKGSIPRTFDLEDQCLFHLGYYQQLAYQPYAEPPHCHKTLNGDMVRSKSEVIVANLLWSLGLQYEYEAPLTVGQGDNRRTIHPDFTIRKTKDGRPIYIEHLGMMDNFTYRSDWKERLVLFGQAGISPIDDGGGPNGVLITTSEEPGSIDCEAIRDRLQAIVDNQVTE